MPILPFNVSAAGLDHFIYRGVIFSTSYFLFLRVETNRLVGRITEKFIDQSLHTGVNTIPCIIFFPRHTYCAHSYRPCKIWYIRMNTPLNPRYRFRHVGKAESHIWKAKL